VPPAAGPRLPWRWRAKSRTGFQPVQSIHLLL